MISSREIKFEQDNPVPNGTTCTALYDALPEYGIDLDFKKGEKVVIVEPCNVLFFYIGRNLDGNEGVIPINYFKFDTAKRELPEAVASNDFSKPPRSPRVAPKPRRLGSTETPQSPKPVPVPRVRVDTLLRGQSLPSQSSLVAAYDDRDITKAKYSDIDRRPPMPLPQDAVALPVSSMAADKFKTDSGWFMPSLPHVSSSLCSM